MNKKKKQKRFSKKLNKNTYSPCTDPSKSEIETVSTLNDLTSIDRCSLCIDVLCEGFVNSFIEFFYLSHRYNENIELQDINMSPDELIYLKENLVMAELSARKNDFIKTHSAYKNIADFFKKNKEYSTAIYFYNKCYNVICEKENENENDNNNTSKLQQIKLITYLDLGLTYESLKEIDSAIKFHELYLKLSTILCAENEIKFAHRNLIRTFKLQSDQLMCCNKYEEAMEILSKCILLGKKANDLNGECIAHRTTGNILFKLKQYQKSIIHYKKYLKICFEIDDKKSELAGNAYLKLGESYQQIGDNILAAKYFESYMNIASGNNELKSESEACLALGDIYCNNEYNKAIKYYMKTFELNRKLNDQKKVNDVRIKLGIAKSKQQINTYLDKLTSNNYDDLKQLIKWKNKRIPLNSKKLQKKRVTF